MAQYSIATVGPIAGATPVSDASPMPVTGSSEQTGAVIRPTVTLTATPDYSANDVVGGIVELTGVVSASGRSALLRSVVAKDAGGQAPAITLLFFRATPSGGAYADNDALTWGSGDHANLVGVVRIAAADWYTVISKSQVALGGIDVLMGAAATSLFLLVVADATWNAGATTDLTLEFGFEQR